MIIDRRMLYAMYQDALHEYKNTLASKHEADNEFLARCWCDAFIGVIKGEGYDVKVIRDTNDVILDGVESISVIDRKL